MTQTKKKPTRYYSSRQEKKIAKAIKGKKVANSGATSFNKGDVVTDNWLIEAKTCTSPKSSFSVKKDWLIKNKEEAFAMRKQYNALAIDFGSGENYFIVDEHTFKEIVSCLK